MLTTENFVLYYVCQKPRGYDMATQQEYLEQDRLVQENTMVVQPWLENFANEYNSRHPYEIGTMFYSDVTILSGPHGNFYCDTDAGKKLNELHKIGKVSIFYVKFAGGAFIIEYKFDGTRIYRYKDSLIKMPHKIPVNAYFLYNGRQYPVSMDVALAVERLYSAQEYRSILYANLHNK